jgi:hypothetical protein
LAGKGGLEARTIFGLLFGLVSIRGGNQLRPCEPASEFRRPIQDEQ